METGRVANFNGIDGGGAPDLLSTLGGVLLQ